jgi:phage terminase large subunit-like protein
MSITSIANWPPRYLTPVPEETLDAGRARTAIQFVELFGVITKDSVAGPAGSPLILRDWQREIIKRIYADDGREGFRHRISYVGLPRKNGKSALASTLALADLFVLGGRGAEVYSIAAEKEQARIVFSDAKRIIESHEELSSMAKLYRDAIEVPSLGSVYRVLSAESYSKEGLSPTAVWADEIHAMQNRELWDVMSLAMGARGSKSHMVGITTSGTRSDQTGNDSIAYSLYQYGKKLAAQEVEDDTFFMAWWEAAESADHRAVETWQEANPGYGDICAAEDFVSAVRTTPEAEFRTKRCNQWVNTKAAWLPAGAWEGVAQEFELQPDDEYILGFDGSWKNDSTAVVGVILPRTEDDVYRAFRVAHWEKDFALDDDSWIVDKGLVAKTVIDFFFQNPNCREIVCDPTYWQDEMFQWSEAGLAVTEYPNTVSRTVPATAKLYEAIMNGKLVHNGDGALTRHMDNCILKIDSNRGARITKDYRNPRLKIDLAIALLMAYDRASARLEAEITPQFFI